MSRRWLIPLAAVPVLAVLAYGFRSDPRAIPSPLVGRPAMALALTSYEGAPMGLEALRGKVVLLNFWVTWCGSCRAEMPTIDALYRRYKNRGLEVVAVNIDAATTSTVQAFVGKLGVTFRVGLDPSSSTARTYRVAGLPTTYLIDRAGNVVVQEVGARDWLDAVSRSAIEGLLQLPEPAQEAGRSPPRLNEFLIRGSDVFMTK